eukprot:1583896-Rhodomonas_salina.1
MHFFIGVPVSASESEEVQTFTLVVALELCAALPLRTGVWQVGAFGSWFNCGVVPCLSYLFMFLALCDCVTTTEGTHSRSLPEHGAWTCGEIVVRSAISRQ